MTSSDDGERALAPCADVFVRYWAKARPTTVAIDGPDDRLTYGELAERTARIIGGFSALGLQKGDRIAWLGKNSALYFELFLASARAGIVMVPIGWRLSNAEILWMAGDAKVKALFLGEGFDAVKSELCDSLALAACFTAREAFDWIARSEPVIFEPAGTGDAILQLYTSGTTGNPKGVILSNANMFALRETNKSAGNSYHVFAQGEAILIAMPCAHIGGTGFGTVALGAGITAVVLSEFDPRAVFDAVENQGVTRLFVVPSALQLLLNHPDCGKVDFGRVSHLLYGASPIPLELLRAAMEVFDAGFLQCYGMTETTGTVCVLSPEDHDVAGNVRMRSAGKPLPGVEVRIVDHRGQAVALGEIGEIETRSSNNMLGYWKLADATAKAMNEGGWVATGDAGYLDDDGYVYIHDRIKDVIISGGENIYPAQVENAIFGHPDIAEVAVIGVPDEKWGEAVKAICVAREGHQVNPDSVIRWTRERLAAFKAPKSVDVVASLPRNASGKILRRELRAPYWSGRERMVN